MPSGHHRFSEGIFVSLILYRMIQKDVILFRILCLVPEYEIVQYRGVKDVEEISPVGISSSFECILRSPADSDAFQSGRYAEHNGHPETPDFIV